MKLPRSLLWASLLLGAATQGCSTTNPYYDPNKAHHRPNGFVNSDGTVVSKDFSDLVRWYRERFGKSLPAPPSEFRSGYEAFPVHPFKAEAFNKLNGDAVAWLGHATVLLRTDGLTTLTDPHFSERAFPVQFAGPRRKVKSPATVSDLPKVDVVLISHNHYDHMDKNSLIEISKTQPRALFLVPLGVEQDLKSWGINNVIALDWWQTHTVGQHNITFVPAYHWSARTLLDRNTTLWGGWTVKSPQFNFYFSGDTGYNDRDFKAIGERLGPFNLSAIAVGAYEPRWFMKAQHINPAEAIQIHKDVRSLKSIGVHWGTFELTDEPLDQPIGDVSQGLVKSGLNPEDFTLFEHGQQMSLSD